MIGNLRSRNFIGSAEQWLQRMGDCPNYHSDLPLQQLEHLAQNLTKIKA